MPGWIDTHTHIGVCDREVSGRRDFFLVSNSLRI
jgi:imidazolonepropionase-like amidohydrolase